MFDHRDELAASLYRASGLTKLTMPLSRYIVGTDPDTNSHATCQ